MTKAQYSFHEIISCNICGASSDTIKLMCKKYIPWISPSKRVIFQDPGLDDKKDRAWAKLLSY